jgi:luciferase family oxidoreductase group 1
MTLPISLLDLSLADTGSNSGQALRNTIELGQLADRLGYSRYWLAEHHNMNIMTSPAPEIMIAHVAQVTERIRVGSGGIMLPNHAPLKVAEMFQMLEALHPGRIDLGIGSASGTDPKATLALQRSRETSSADQFPQQLEELLAFSGEGKSFPIGHPFHTVRATPRDIKLPPIWLLGSSDHGAQVAAAMGFGFAFAHHIKPNFMLSAIEKYRTQFVPSERLPAPKVILTTTVICAETDEQAEDLAASMCLVILLERIGRLDKLPSPEEARAYPYTSADLIVNEESRTRQIVGRPEVVREKLLQLVEQSGADELMISAFVYGHENRAKMYELLANAFDLQSSLNTTSTGGPLSHAQTIQNIVEQGVLADQVNHNCI